MLQEGQFPQMPFLHHKSWKRSGWNGHVESEIYGRILIVFFVLLDGSLDRPFINQLRLLVIQYMGLLMSPSLSFVIGFFWVIRR